MSIRTLVACAALPVALGASGTAVARPIAHAAIMGADGRHLGEATMTSGAHGSVVLRLSVAGLPPGTHGVHLHTTGKCDAPGFTSAGGHLNPAGHQHGTLNPAGSHLGDLPNLVVDAKGRARLDQPIAEPADMLRGQIFDSDGTAIVIHAGPDDYRTDPSGNSGARIACGVFAPG